MRREGRWSGEVPFVRKDGSAGVAETLDWATALVELDAVALDPKQVTDTLGVLLKYQDDIQKMQGSEIKAILDEVKVSMRPDKVKK